MSDNYKLSNVSSMEKHSHKWQDEAMKSEIHDLKTWIMYVKQLDKYNRKYQRLDFVLNLKKKGAPKQNKISTWGSVCLVSVWESGVYWPSDEYSLCLNVLL